QTAVSPSSRDELLDLAEGHDKVPRGGLIQTQRQKGGRQRAGRRDEPPRKRTLRILVRRRCARDEARAVAIAKTRAMREQGVAVGKIRVRVQRNRGDLELAR